MDADFLVIQNTSREGPGRIAGYLETRGISSLRIDAEAGPLPDPRNFAAVLVLGGPASANYLDTWMLAELAFAETVLLHNIPVFGVCLGLQVLVKAGGGQVVRNHVKEIGFQDPAGEPYTIQLTPAGKSDPVCSGMPDNTRIFQLHGETVVPTASMTTLATGRYCEQQLVRVGERAWGIQGHFELTRELLVDWLAEDPDLMPLDASTELRRFAEVESQLAATCAGLFNNFLDLAGL